MNQICEIRSLAQSVIGIEQKPGNQATITPVFRFPYNNDYYQWIEEKIAKPPERRDKWMFLYNEIIQREIIPSGNSLPSHWPEALFRSITNCVYVIASEDLTILYIGKSEFPAIGRIIDRFIPKKSDQFPYGQVENNTPEIWEKYISKERHVYYSFCYDLSFNPELLEYYLLDQFIISNKRLPLYNKKMPSYSFQDRVMELKKLIGKQNS
jgi:hypothetical protein